MSPFEATFFVSETSSKCLILGLFRMLYCFRPRRYKTFESYSQPVVLGEDVDATVSDREDTKLLKAIHNKSEDGTRLHGTVSDREDTKLLKAIHNNC